METFLIVVAALVTTNLCLSLVSFLTGKRVRQAYQDTLQIWILAIVVKKWPEGKLLDLDYWGANSLMQLAEAMLIDGESTKNINKFLLEHLATNPEIPLPTKFKYKIFSYS